ncbi:MAG TPA: winged helix DNA-binding domain-containing protein [Jatrophihabitans sp.]|jgi:hypothetical protein|uniref:winged helix DNA-binding domain-containing protein n=1 Tax=Jatrophihabitans sp. TaxID=1932789 RepID=UPI002EE12399
MSLTARQLNRATLGRQLLLRREPLDVVTAVRRVVAIQAQEAASPYLALWNRVAGFDAAELDAAFTDHAIVKASLMRITLHAVTAEDYPVFHTAMLTSLRASRLYDRRFTSIGLSTAEADALMPHLLEFATQPRSNADFEALLNERLGERLGPVPKPGPWWALRTFAPLVHARTGGPWSFGPRPSYVAARTRPHQGDREECIQRLVLRYLEGFGPATAADVAQFTLLTRSTVRDALAALAGSLERLSGPDGVELFDVPGGVLPCSEVSCPPRLMAMWDSTLLAYADRSRVIPPDYRRLVIRQNGDVLPTLLVDGYVAGVWRPVDGGIEATAFHRLGDQAWQGLADEARQLTAFLADRDPAVYRRYSRWWDALPSAEVITLPAVS